MPIGVANAALRVPPRPLRVSEPFTGADIPPETGLGVTAVGSVPWTPLRGPWGRSANRPVTTAADAENPFVVVPFIRTPNVNIKSNLGIGGDAIYFRVKDVRNWWRAITQYKNESYTYYVTEYQYTKTTEYTEYEYRQASQTNSGGSPSHTHQHFSSTIIWSRTGPADSSFSHSHTTSPSTHTHTVDWVWTLNTRKVYEYEYLWSTSSTTAPAPGYVYNGTTRQTPVHVNGVSYPGLLEVCLDGIISRVSGWNTQTGAVEVRTRNTGLIELRVNNSTNPVISITDHRLSRMTLHGIGRGSSSIVSHNMTYFEITTDFAAGSSTRTLVTRAAFPPSLVRTGSTATPITRTTTTAFSTPGVTTV